MSQFVDTNSTGPRGSSWVVTENNATAFDSGLTAFAVCGKANGYKVVKGSPFSNPANAQSGASAVCKAPTVPIGGGVFSASKSVAVNIEGTISSGDRWDSFINNATAFAATATPVAVCASR